MPSFITNFFTANRIAALSTWLAGLAGLILGIVGTFPHAWQNAALAIAGLLTKMVTALKFLDGSQKWDNLTANNPTSSSLPVDEINDEINGTRDFQPPESSETPDSTPPAVS